MANGFTYCWSDHSTAKVYVGIHLGSPDDGYICSSKTMLSEYKARPLDFTREILFSGPYDMCATFEKAIINGLFKQDKSTFYNRSNGKKILFDDEIRKKMSVKSKGRKMPFGHLEKMLSARKGKPGPRNGVVLSDEIKKKISEARKGMISPNKGKIASAETRKKMSDSAKKKAPFSDEHKAKLSLAAKADWAKRKQEKNLG